MVRFATRLHSSLAPRSFYSYVSPTEDLAGVLAGAGTGLQVHIAARGRERCNRGSIRTVVVVQRHQHPQPHLHPLPLI